MLKPTGGLFFLVFICIASCMLAQNPDASPTPETTQPRKLRVSQGVAQQNRIHSVAPRYPAEAKAKHIQGDVTLQGTIDRQGNVIQIKPVYGDPLLMQAAIDAVKQWKYKPYMLNGEPVEVETTFKIRFAL